MSALLTTSDGTACATSTPLSMDMDDKLVERALSLADGNPGAITVLAKVLRDASVVTHTVLDALEKLRWTGPTIWVAYKNVCKEDYDEFSARVILRDPSLMDKVDKLFAMRAKV